MANNLGNQSVLRSTIPFTPSEISQISSFQAAKQYPQAYAYIYNLITTKYTVDADTRFWFQQAQGINAASGPASRFIRTFSAIGVAYVGESQRIENGGNKTGQLTDMVPAA